MIAADLFFRARVFSTRPAAAIFSALDSKFRADCVDACRAFAGFFGPCVLRLEFSQMLPGRRRWRASFIDIGVNLGSSFFH